MTEEIKWDYAKNPEKIIDPQTCNYVIAFLGGHIADLVETEWEKRLIASQHKVQLLNSPDKTNAEAKALWEVSEEYIAWQETVRTLRKFRAYKGDLKDRFEVLTGKKRY